MNAITSIVLVRMPQGWVASLRFKNAAFDAEISSASRVVILSQLERIVYRACGRNGG